MKSCTCYNGRNWYVLTQIHLPAGEYCQGAGLPEPTGLCAPGWFCSRGAFTNKPSPIYNGTEDSSVVDSTCPIYSLNDTGGICPPGKCFQFEQLLLFLLLVRKFISFYVFQVHSALRGLANPCHALLVSSVVSMPWTSLQDHVMLGISAMAVTLSPTHKCVPLDTTAQKAHPQSNPAPQEPSMVGLLHPLFRYKPHYSDSNDFLAIAGHLGGVNITDCEPCTPGYFCADYGLSAPNGPCERGYFCPTGIDTAQPAQYACSPGHFCLEGSHNETGCPSGYYQPHWRNWDCDICPAGSYCKAFGMLRSITHPSEMTLESFSMPWDFFHFQVIMKTWMLRI